MIWISVYHKTLSYLRKEVTCFFFIFFSPTQCEARCLSCLLDKLEFMNEHHVVEKNKVVRKKSIFNQGIPLFRNVFCLSSHSLIPVIQIFSERSREPWCPQFFHCTSSYQCHVQTPILFDFRKASPTAHVALKNAYTLHTCLMTANWPSS